MEITQYIIRQLWWLAGCFIEYDKYPLLPKMQQHIKIFDTNQMYQPRQENNSIQSIYSDQQSHSKSIHQKTFKSCPLSLKVIRYQCRANLWFCGFHEIPKGSDHLGSFQVSLRLFARPPVEPLASSIRQSSAPKVNKIIFLSRL